MALNDPTGFYLRAATILKEAVADPNEFSCLHCGEPVEDRFWCETCRVEALPPGDGFTPGG